MICPMSPSSVTPILIDVLTYFLGALCGIYIVYNSIWLLPTSIAYTF